MNEQEKLKQALFEKEKLSVLPLKKNLKTTHYHSLPFFRQFFWLSGSSDFFVCSSFVFFDTFLSSTPKVL
jgi:hypothetical protein